MGTDPNVKPLLLPLVLPLLEPAVPATEVQLVPLAQLAMTADPVWIWMMASPARMASPRNSTTIQLHSSPRTAHAQLLPVTRVPLDLKAHPAQLVKKDLPEKTAKPVITVFEVNKAKAENPEKLELKALPEMTAPSFPLKISHKDHPAKAVKTELTAKLVRLANQEMPEPTELQALKETRAQPVKTDPKVRMANPVPRENPDPRDPAPTAHHPVPPPVIRHDFEFNQSLLFPIFHECNALLLVMVKMTRRRKGI